MSYLYLIKQIFKKICRYHQSPHLMTQVNKKKTDNIKESSIGHNDCFSSWLQWFYCSSLQCKDFLCIFKILNRKWKSVGLKYQYSVYRNSSARTMYYWQHLFLKWNYMLVSYISNFGNSDWILSKKITVLKIHYEYQVLPTLIELPTFPYFNQNTEPKWNH